MSIEETYKGMWSSDPDLLKSLLDAGNTIIAKDPERKLVRLFVEDEEYLVDSENQINNTKMRFSGYRFLIPPRPLVLEPKPLDWHPWANGDDGIGAVDGQWNFDIGGSGVWFIMFQGRCVENDSNADVESAKAAIHEWRVNHLKSMLP